MPSINVLIAAKTLHVSLRSKMRQNMLQKVTITNAFIYVCGGHFGQIIIQIRQTLNKALQFVPTVNLWCHR